MMIIYKSFYSYLTTSMYYTCLGLIVTRRKALFAWVVTQTSLPSRPPSLPPSFPSLRHARTRSLAYLIDDPIEALLEPLALFRAARLDVPIVVFDAMQVEA